MSSESSVIRFEKLHFIIALRQNYTEHNSYCYQHYAWHLDGFCFVEREKKSGRCNHSKRWRGCKNRLSCLGWCAKSVTHLKSIF